MNESLRGALLRARLSEEDVAARLQVDPKTVRRWLEGRTPYLRHRWALANILNLQESDLWPHLPEARSWPEEVRAVYPTEESLPNGIWRGLFSSAQQDIDILCPSGNVLLKTPGILALLSERAQAGARIRICLRSPELHSTLMSSTSSGLKDNLAVQIRNDLRSLGPLSNRGEAEIRLYESSLKTSIYRADHEILVFLHAYGISAGRTPVLHMRGYEVGDMVTAYLKNFEDIWAGARSTP